MLPQDDEIGLNELADMVDNAEGEIAAETGQPVGGEID